MIKRKLIFLFLLTINVSLVLAVQPFGANYTEVSNERAPADAPQSHQAIAGNVTELNIQGFTITQSWQGYYGNVSGTIQLADANDRVFYNWSLASPQGEVYASTNDSLDWTNIQCLNYSASGTFADDSANAGGTSQFGLNLTQVESSFNISSDDVDGLNETFTLSGAGTHDLFYTNNLQFSEGECRSTRIFDASGQGVNNNFEEVLLYEPTTRSLVFTSLLDQNALGFDGAARDFQMLVLEDGHNTDTSTTNYYFYVELE